MKARSSGAKVKALQSRSGRYLIGAALAGATLLYCLQGSGADTGDYPEGGDAVAAAPESHRVLFENTLVRVLEVTIPKPGHLEPMHYHRWPSLFVDWDVGGKTNHLRYHRPDGTVRDIPSVDAPSHPGQWKVRWMQPEPMHAIETVEQFNEGKDLRLELKTR
jgi:hypothetical protein